MWINESLDLSESVRVKHSIESCACNDVLVNDEVDNVTGLQTLTLI